MTQIRENPHFYDVPIGKQNQTLEQRLEMMIKLRIMKKTSQIPRFLYTTVVINPLNVISFHN